MTAQKTYSDRMGQHVTRVKLFFGYRYLWKISSYRTQKALWAQASSRRLKASSLDQATLPNLWRMLESSRRTSSTLSRSTSTTTGTEGLGQHFDDYTRFLQPIFTFRLFSDSRLTFGAHGYGFMNNAYFVPLARGASAPWKRAVTAPTA